MKQDFTFSQRLIFWFKSRLLQQQRRFKNITNPNLTHLKSVTVIPSQFECVVSLESNLWQKGDDTEFWHQAGKIENLRRAANQLKNIHVPAEKLFSFWQQVGRTTQRRGFVPGREIREGCIIPSIGGGICQLSNLLYQAALKAGLIVVERHAHSQIVPGSAASLGKDATVFWNYIDLRFSAKQDWYLDVRLTNNKLVVRIFVGKHFVPHQNTSLTTYIPVNSTLKANNCVTCGETSCAMHSPELGNKHDKVAVIVDRHVPEFNTWLLTQKTDLWLTPWPLNGFLKRFLPRNYAWILPPTVKSAHAALNVIYRSWQSRRLSSQGAKRQLALISHDVKLAKVFSSKLQYMHTHLVVQQQFLLALDAQGMLGGRELTILAQRLPIKLLQMRLDELSNLYPQSQTANDFRLDVSFAEREWQCFLQAKNIVTMHPEIAALFPEKTVLLPWQAVDAMAMNHTPETKTQPKLLHIYLPAATLARKGVYLLREALKDLPVKLFLHPGDFEGKGFWQEIDIVFVRPQEVNWANIDLICLPTWLESYPGLLLKAAAYRKTIFTTLASGISQNDHIRHFPLHHVDLWRQAIADTYLSVSKSD